ncbi:hypothetical protein EHO60_02990 [Leptospira fletcheri]|uniref:Uncharacterized protein n=1 Tax=Leptospira fletcheri TaxID=2484981 RepID=A0A4V3JE19_9LEPT|nr:caspase family protein [Leptospira fletcheri]TGK13180.1 hypothetical protein EHO60_02990 [Leptospira fletcheri]
MVLRFLFVWVLLQNSIFAVESLLHPSWKESSGITTFSDLRGGRIATGLENKTVVIWSLKGRFFRVLQANTSIVSSIAYSPFGERIAYQADDSKIRIYSLDTDEFQEIANTGGGSIAAFDFSPDGKFLAGGDENGKIRIWDSKGEIVESISAHDGPVTDLKYASNAKYIASTAEDGKLRIWSPSGKMLNEYVLHNGSVLCLSISPDAKRIAAGGDDGKVRLVDVQAGKIVPLIGHTSSVHSTSFSSDGTYLLSSSEDLTVRLWKEGKEISVLKGHTDTVNRAVFINGGKNVLTGSDDGTQKIFDLKGNLKTNIVLTDKGKIVFNPSGRFDYDSETLESYFFFNSEESPEGFGLETFFNRFYSPELIQTSLSEIGGEQTLSELYRSSPPPKVQIQIQPDPNTDSASIQGTVCDAGGGIEDVYAYHNGSLISKENSRSVRMIRTGNCLQVMFKSALLPGSNSFRIGAESKAGLVAYSETKNYQSLRKSASKTTLHLVLIAIDDYPGSSMDLKYAVKDATAIMKKVSSAGDGTFDKVVAYTAYNGQATKSGIEELFQKVARSSGPEDALLVFIAGHGTEKSGNFFFLTSSYRVDTPEDVRSGFSQQEFISSISKIPATRKLIIFDTCDSGGEWITQFKDISSFAKTAGVCVIASTLEKEEAYESSELAHGILTTALLEGLEGKARTNGKITAASLISYVNLRVPELAKTVLKKEQYPYSSQRGRDFTLNE